MAADSRGATVKASNAQLVPAYAYDQRLSHVVYIRDRESDKGSGYMGASQGNGRPSGIYQFSTLKGMHFIIHSHRDSTVRLHIPTR